MWTLVTVKLTYGMRNPMTATYASFVHQFRFSRWHLWSRESLFRNQSLAGNNCLTDFHDFPWGWLGAFHWFAVGAPFPVEATYGPPLRHISTSRCGLWCSELVQPAGVTSKLYDTTRSSPGSETLWILLLNFPDHFLIFRNLDRIDFRDQFVVIILCRSQPLYFYLWNWFSFVEVRIRSAIIRCHASSGQ
jgi:hypothetical protein